jgi:hypothetical protein
MKREMRHHFVPAYYSRDLHLKLKHLVQGTHTVDEYFQELEMCLLRTGITEERNPQWPSLWLASINPLLIKWI